MARAGVTPAQLEKRAGVLGNVLGTVGTGISYMSKSILAASLLAGIPLGVLGHAVGRATATDNRAEREALDRLRYFQRMSAGMTTGLETPTNNEEEDTNARGAV
jgi:putative effector of murein hydrolase